ncbi:hypothetical protein H1R20_g960, partial [Candolleomyces eurysporus]
MTAIKVYLPLDSNLHLTLPNNHANSIYTTSPFTYKLDEEFDFVKIFPTNNRNHTLIGLDPTFMTALFWAITQVKEIINRATKGAVPSVAVNMVIPDELFDYLGMKKPKLLVLLERADIDPLYERHMVGGSIVDEILVRDQLRHMLQLILTLLPFTSLPYLASLFVLEHLRS